MADCELKVRIQEETKDAMRAGAKQRLGALRLIMSEIKRVEVDERIELDETRVLAILDKMAKQRRDSLAQYRQANRQDLADQEQFELDLLAEFLPAQLGEGELDALIDAAIAESGATGMKEMGGVMGTLKPRVQGRADMGLVSRKVRERLS